MEEITAEKENCSKDIKRGKRSLELLGKSKSTKIPLSMS
jgi:hypothetical protein